MEGKKRGLLLLGAMIVGTFGFLVGAYYYYVSFIGTKQELLGYWDVFREFLTEHSFWLFASIAVFPAFIIPVAPLLTLAGFWGETNGVWLAWGYASLAVIANLTWTYWLAAGPGHNLIKRMLRRTKYNIPQPDPGNELFMALILRLVPGVPFIFTNYVLGLIRMPFHRYFIVSAPILIITVGGYVLTVGGLLGKQWKIFCGGLSIILVMIVVGRLISRKHGRDKQV